MTDARSFSGLKVAHRLFSESVCDVALTFSEDGLVDFMTDTSRKLLCVGANELLGISFEDVLCDDGSQQIGATALEAARTGEASVIEVQVKTGLNAGVPLRMKVFRDPATEKLWACGIDLTASRQVEAELRRRATHDPLTELPNRHVLHERLAWHIENAQRLNSKFAVCMLDLDGFKKVNDAFGHLAGDELLKVVGARLQDAVRSGDTVSRTGGDEFMLVLADIEGSAGVHRACERILDVVRKPIKVADQEVYVSTSVGVALFPEHGEVAGELAQHADMAMYQSKQQGRNRYSVFSSDLQPTASQVSVEASMFSAISQGEFLVHFQPLVSPDGVIKGCEALMRWIRADGTSVSPAEFIPVAENNGLINVLGDYVLRAAAMQLVRFDQMGLPGLYMSVNVSPRQLRHPDFEKNLRKVLALTGLEPSRLVLEITESLLMNEQQKTLALLRKISDLGVRFSLDDFGTGYSCLAYLKTYPISNLKIDRSFIQELEQDPVSAAIVKAIIELARAIGLKTVVEGVETAGQAHALRAMGVDYFQGFYFARPMPAQSLLDKYTAT